jgi:hypothetical protein
MGYFKEGNELHETCTTPNDVGRCGLFSGFVVSPGQTPEIIPLSAEPHHHLALHNEYVNVYRVEVAPHDSVILHRHDADAISVMLDDAEVIVRAPGKQDVQQKLARGQVRLQASGYVHSTTIESEHAYRNITVELLRPQQGPRNLCATVAPGLPQNCPAGTSGTGAALSQPLFETGQTRLTIYRVLPHQEVTVTRRDGPELLVTLDSGVRIANETQSSLLSGDFLWLEKQNSQAKISNPTEQEIALILFEFTHP